MSESSVQVSTVERSAHDAQIVQSPRASVIIVTYNSEHYIQSCLNALYAQGDDDTEVIVVDNDSSDGTRAVITTHFPQVYLIESGENLGFAGGNNRGAHMASGEILVFINPDTVVGDNWLAPLLEPLHKDETIGITTPKILLTQQPTRINTAGNDVHFTGFGSLHGWMAQADSLNEQRDVMSISGAAFAIRASLYKTLHGFDEAFFPAYTEDTDLSWRAQLLGFRCVYVPESIVYHDYTLHFNPNKLFWLERNRYQMLLKVLRWRTLILMIPAFFLAEIITWGYALLNGNSHLRAKFRSYTWMLRHIPQILQHRKPVQTTRCVSDHTLMQRCTHRMAFGQTSDGLLARIAGYLFDPIFYLMQRFYLLVIPW